MFLSTFYLFIKDAYNIYVKPNILANSQIDTIKKDLLDQLLVQFNTMVAVEDEEDDEAIDVT
jgi:hypothetical protein